MERWITAVILGSAAMMPAADGQSLPAVSGLAAATKIDSPSSDLPSIPLGKSTIFGGEIRDLDPVRDQLTLRVFGDRPLKILFDERTQVFRDGKKVSLRELRPEQQASVQTTLDGTKIFALSIHMLTNNQQGEYEGRVLSFDQSTGELVVASGLSGETVKVRVDSSTSLVRKGPSTFSSGRAGAADLREGTLVSVKFGAGGKSLPSASEVAILATPGASFVFGGNLAALNMRDGFLVVADPRDQKSYQVFFTALNSSAAQTLRVGQQVRVLASYDGRRYVATEITPM
jgi:cold shock CspA family protein